MLPWIYPLNIVIIQVEASRGTQGVQSYVIFVAQGTVKNQSDVCCSISEWISILGSVYIYNNNNNHNNNNTYIYIGKHAVVKPSFGGKNPRWVTKRWYLDAASRGAPTVTPHSTCKIHVTHWVVEMLRSNTSHQLKVQVPDLSKIMIIKKKNNRFEDV